ncbi:FecCD family ABC transporter permease [Symbiobacterium terraclitae]|uniref:FecCD family ABC transporter permease n=1 Tax=Symbiobacterium terraclitae TaxID=557451 RepID=UPI0035B50D8A
MTGRAARGRRAMAAALVALVAALIVAGALGSVRIPPADVVKILLNRLGADFPATWPRTWEAILWDVRFPRVAMGALVGMGLSVAGAAYQGLFRNPLADPSVIGASAGSSLGAAVAIAFLEGVALLPGAWRLGPVPLFAFCGGVAAVLLVFRLATAGRQTSTVSLLLAGMVVSTIAGSLVSLIMYLTDSQARDAIVFWLMGGLSGANWWKVAWLLPYLAAGLGILLWHGRELNAFLLGEEAALSMGVDVERLKRRILGAGSLLTAAAVAFCGIISFVGLIVPHLVRLLVGPDHRWLLPASAVTGALVLVAADTVARSLPWFSELPVGLVMSLLGGPVFLVILRRQLLPRP